MTSAATHTLGNLSDSPSSVLIVEDELITAEDLRRFLTDEGMNVVGISATAEEAVRLAQELRPDFVLMDIQLAGEMDGLLAAEKIYQSSLSSILFLTAYSDAKVLERSRASQPLAYLIKPFSERQLRAAFQVAIEQRKRQQDLHQSSQSERMQGSRALGYGLAHNLNNLHAHLLGKLEILKSQMQPQPSTETIIEMESVVWRMSSLLRKISLYSHPLEFFGSSEQTIDIELCIKTAIALVDSIRVEREIEIEFQKNKDAAKKKIAIEGHQPALVQAFVHVLFNALEFSEPHSTVKIEAKWIETYRPIATLGRCLPRAEYVEVAVHDTGCGIATDHISKIFDPFFSSQGDATQVSGRGLGLSIVWAVVDLHQGGILVDTTPGGGTSVRLLLPSKRSS